MYSYKDGLIVPRTVTSKPTANIPQLMNASQPRRCSKPVHINLSYKNNPQIPEKNKIYFEKIKYFDKKYTI